MRSKLTTLLELAGFGAVATALGLVDYRLGIGAGGVSAIIIGYFGGRE